ncbi:hypothetical protein HD806DRAFT_153005 [Xylariaceae sp. AK1471]|nr:hypothetical protein HD806DRAFT_153005 [Xylariaceae sp. AK1471]
MVFRTLPASVLALWLLVGHALSQSSITDLPTPTTVSDAPIVSSYTGITIPGTDLGEVRTSTFTSPSLNQGGGGLSESAKTGISVGVTLASILLIGSITILCIIRRRNKALTKPQTRAPVGDVDEEDMAVGDGLGRGKDEGYCMSPTPAAPHGVLQQAPDGFVFQGGGYPTIPNPTYMPQQQQQTHTMLYPTGQPGEVYAYPGTAYPGTAVVDPSQQNGYAGPSHSQYHPETQLQPQLQQQQEGSHISWVYPVSATSTGDPAHIQDYQYNYLQDYQSTHHNPDQIALDHNEYQNMNPASFQVYHEDSYHVPPPHPHASELPDQRKPVEMMGEGHYNEAP